MKTCCFFLVLIFFGCSTGRPPKPGTFTIHGQFSNSKGEKIVLCELDVKQVVPLDSAALSNDGKVMFEHAIDQPGFYLLIFPDGTRMTLVVRKGEDVLIRGDLKEAAETFSAEGSEGTEMLVSFFRKTLQNKVRIDSIKNILRNSEGSDDFLKVSMMADSLFSCIASDQKKIGKDFIDNHRNSLASLIVLNYAFGPRPVLTMEDDLPYYLKLTGLWRLYPQNKHLLFHMERVSLYLNNLKNPPN